MNYLARLALTIGAVALFAACGALPQAQGDMQSSMLSNFKTRNLLYVSADPEEVYVYTYPQGELLATLGVPSPYGVCSSRAGDVFITSSQGIYEYAHGGATPIAILDAPGAACSVDPTTGSLAVVNGYGVSIFQYKPKRGWRLPRWINFGPSLLFGGYDPKGNLFVDGTNAGALIFAELPKGSHTFSNIALNQSVESPGNVQWDGQYVSLQDDKKGVLYRVAISGSTGTVVGSTRLARAGDSKPPWIQGGRVLDVSENGRYVAFWRYPNGGGPLKRIAVPESPYGVTVSLGRGAPF